MLNLVKRDDVFIIIDHEIPSYVSVEDKDVSGISEVSDYVPNNLNSTTTKLNRILERVNVSDQTQLSELNKSDDAFSEVPFESS